MTAKTKPTREAKARPLDRLTSPTEAPGTFAPTYAEALADRDLFRQLRKVMLRSERLWLIDCDGDYKVYRMRLRALAKDYKIPVPAEQDPEKKD